MAGLCEGKMIGQKVLGGENVSWLVILTGLLVMVVVGLEDLLSSSMEKLG